MMWVPGCSCAAGIPTDVGETATASSDMSLPASVSVELEIGQVGVADVPAHRIPALEHQSRSVLGSGDALGREFGRLHHPPGVLGGVETFVSGAGHYDADIVIDEAISIGAVGSGDRAVEILQGAARELARPRLET
jgi:hypothetical protein